jgi:Flp pilus assembly pilin Flp
MVVKKGGERIMELLKRLVVEEEGQGLVEYTLIVLLVALVFWVAIRSTNVGQALSNSWTQVVGELNNPTGGS